METKVCADCKEEKSVDEFYLYSRAKGTRHSYCKECHGRRNKQWKLDNPERAKELARKHQYEAITRIKHEMVEAYGGKCECCGEDEIHFLTLDHIHGVPQHHRHSNGKRVSGLALLRKVKNEGFPPEYRILCWNCNAAHGFYGFCPHQPHSEEDRRH